MDYKDYYKILGVSKNAEQKEIKSAYRRLARKYHPDKNQGDSAAGDRLKTINEAYEVLGNPDNRTRYDQLGRNYHRFQQGGGNPGDFDYSQWFGGGGGRGRAGGPMDDPFGGQGGAGFSQFFESIFGGGAFGGASGQRPRQRGGREPNLDIEQTIELSLEEAYHGTSREFSHNGDRFTAKIPPGAKTGTRIRLRGKGNSGRSRAGDLFLIVKVTAHETFDRDDINLRVKVEVDVLTAVLGGAVTVPTLTGPVNLTIPPGTQGGQTVRLKGKGMPHLKKSEPPGDLLAKLHIRIPVELSGDERELYQRLYEFKQEEAVG